MVSRFCAVSIDLDEIYNYYAIHGHPLPSGVSTQHTVYEVAVPRFLQWAEAQQIPLTLFAVGRDLTHTKSAEQLREAVSKGHAIGNHTYSHRYDFSRLSQYEMAREIDLGTEQIIQATGQKPRGFRAPGYTINDEVFRLLPGLGFRYDSSVFPCPMYMAIKDLAIVWYQLQRRSSRSIIDTPAVLSAPTQPYRVGQPYWKRGNQLLEFPIQVTPRLRLPYIGTLLMMAGSSYTRWLTQSLIGQPLINLELHGIDLLDQHDPELHSLSQVQRDLMIPLKNKLDVLNTVIQTLRAAEYRFITLDEAATHFG